jgi:hypothetical protein
MSFHASLGLELTDTLALTARGDAHAVMHSEMVALFGGLGLSWTP